jgi:hypothetical protein
MQFRLTFVYVNNTSPPSWWTSPSWEVGDVPWSGVRWGWLTLGGLVVKTYVGAIISHLLSGARLHNQSHWILTWMVIYLAWTCVGFSRLLHQGLPRSSSLRWSWSCWITTRLLSDIDSDPCLQPCYGALAMLVLYADQRECVCTGFGGCTLIN